jgi:hypothetical protein
MGARVALEDRAAPPPRELRRELPVAQNIASASSHGADTSGIPQASASNGRMVGMPGSASTYGRRGTCTVTRWRANASGARWFGSQPP